METAVDRSKLTRARVLEAAGRLFAHRGLDGATTREIAREAGVNEVTLFRLFQSKERLQSAVLQHVLSEQETLLASQPSSKSADLRSAVRQFAINYVELIAQNLPLIRMLIGGVHRPGDQEACLLRGVFQPLKAELLEILQSALADGRLRPDLDLTLAHAILPEMILVDMLRRDSTSMLAPPYERDAHLDFCVEVFLRGIVADAAILK